jgi:hypothetical protein
MTNSHASQPRHDVQRKAVTDDLPVVLRAQLLKGKNGYRGLFGQTEIQVGDVGIDVANRRVRRPQLRAAIRSFRRV